MNIATITDRLAPARRTTDLRLAAWLARYSVTVLRVSLGLTFLGFGVLKFFPGMSPAEPLAAQTLHILTLGLIPDRVALIGVASLESAIGILLLSGRLLRLALALLALEMIGILSPLVLLPARDVPRPRRANPRGPVRPQGHRRSRCRSGGRSADARRPPDLRRAGERGRTTSPQFRQERFGSAVTSTSALPVSRNDRTGFLSAAIAAMLFGAAYPVTAIALRSFQPVALAALTGTLALAVIVLLAVVGPLSRPRDWMLTRGQAGQLAVLGLLGGVAFAAALNVAVGLAGPTITSFVATLYAVLATLFAVPLLGERIQPSQIAALAVALVGTVLLAGFDPLGTPILGILVALGAAIAFALYLVLARRWGAGHALDGTLVTIAVLIGRGPVLLLVELLREPDRILPASPDLAAVVALALLVVGPSTTAQLAVLASVKRVPARRTSAALLLTPPASAAIAAVVLNERLAPMEIIGAALVLAGIAGASGALEFIARGRNRHGVARDQREPVTARSHDGRPGIATI